MRYRISINHTFQCILILLYLLIIIIGEQRSVNMIKSLYSFMHSFTHATFIRWHPRQIQGYIHYVTKNKNIEKPLFGFLVNSIVMTNNILYYTHLKKLKWVHIWRRLINKTCNPCQQCRRRNDIIRIRET